MNPGGNLLGPKIHKTGKKAGVRSHAFTFPGGHPLDPQFAVAGMGAVDYAFILLL